MNTTSSMRAIVLNAGEPVLETEFPLDGSRFEGLIPPVVRQPISAIRRRSRHIFSLDQYERNEFITNKFDLLKRLRRRENFADHLGGCSHVEVIRAAVAAKKTHSHVRLDGICGCNPLNSGSKRAGVGGTRAAAEHALLTQESKRVREAELR